LLTLPFIIGLFYLLLQHPHLLVPVIVKERVVFTKQMFIISGVDGCVKPGITRLLACDGLNNFSLSGYGALRGNLLGRILRGSRTIFFFFLIVEFLVSVEVGCGGDFLGRFCTGGLPLVFCEGSLRVCEGGEGDLRYCSAGIVLNVSLTIRRIDKEV
jgi:hypothetical protein